MKKRLKYLDHLKFLAIILMLIGHLIGVGTNAYSIPLVINGEMSEPIIPSNIHSLWKLESFLYCNFHTSCGRIGTVLFFIISGYLTTKTRDKYKSKEYIIRKILRIFPTLIVCIVIIGVYLKITQGISYPLINYIATMTMTYWVMNIPSIIGEIWFLFVLLLFYVLIIPIKKIDIGHIYFMFVIAFIFILLNYYFKQIYIPLFALGCRYVSFILTGAMLAILDRDTSALDACKKVKMYSCHIFNVILLAFVVFRFNFLLIDDHSLDYTLGTFLWSYGIFGLYFYINLVKPTIFRFGYRFASFFSEIAMPTYILHVTVGLGSMYYLKNSIGVDNAYLLLFISSVIVTSLAYIIYYFVEKPISKHLPTIVSMVD